MTPGILIEISQKIEFLNVTTASKIHDLSRLLWAPPTRPKSREREFLPKFLLYAVITSSVDFVS